MPGTHSLMYIDDADTQRFRWGYSEWVFVRRRGSLWTQRCSSHVIFHSYVSQYASLVHLLIFDARFLVFLRDVVRQGNGRILGFAYLDEKRAFVGGGEEEDEDSPLLLPMAIVGEVMKKQIKEEESRGEAEWWKRRKRKRSRNTPLFTLWGILSSFSSEESTLPVLSINSIGGVCSSQPHVDFLCYSTVYTPLTCRLIEWVTDDRWSALLVCSSFSSPISRCLAALLLSPSVCSHGCEFWKPQSTRNRSDWRWINLWWVAGRRCGSQFQKGSIGCSSGTVASCMCCWFEPTSSRKSVRVKAFVKAEGHTNNFVQLYNGPIHHRAVSGATNQLSICKASWHASYLTNYYSSGDVIILVAEFGKSGMSPRPIRWRRIQVVIFLVCWSRSHGPFLFC